MAASGSLSNNKNNVVGFAALIMAMLLLVVPAATSSVGVSIVGMKQVFCGVDGNLPPVFNGTNIVGAVNANVTLRCGNNTIVSAVADGRGLVNITANVPVGVVNQIIVGNCSLYVHLPVANCPALNLPGTLVAPVSVQSIITGLLPSGGILPNIALSIGNFVRAAIGLGI